MLLCFALLEGISLMMGLGISDFLSDLLGLPDGGDVPSDVPDAAASTVIRAAVGLVATRAKSMSSRFP